MTGRLAAMRDGALQQVGTPHEIHERPVNGFVTKSFGLHSTNIYPVAELSEAAIVSCRIGDARVGLPSIVTAQGRLRTSMALALGARPSMMTVISAGEPLARDLHSLEALAG